MPEAFLHYVWQTLSFDMTGLSTTRGLPVFLLRQGQLNTDAGPDFSRAHIRIGDIEWSGSVEMHLATEDWYRHGHETDTAYNGVMLHVVWQSSGREVVRADGTIIPEVALEGRVSPTLLARFDTIQLATTEIPCAGLIGAVPALVRTMWVERLAIERVARKAHAMQARLATLGQDWGQALWEELCARMGGTVNGDAFRAMAQALPWMVVRHYTAQTLSLESLLFGTLGLLNGHANTQGYALALRKEWGFLRNKHSLSQGSPIPLKLSRMRPAAFPTIRLSQLAAMLGQFPDPMALLTPAGLARFQQADMGASAYWDTHFLLDSEESAHQPKRLGDDHKDVILINGLVPMAYLYGVAHGKDDLTALIENVLSALPKEQNRITRPLEVLGFLHENALHSQGLIELKKQYCDAKRCLSCAIGHKVLKSPS